ncbi:cation diffusion facilitator family transporter [Candidatus Halobonum tyrrellensis G22]|uniref:Cation diffusion facilitator family transporter n=1 Tax=Candidatus Halobonum tyrrellensis G22 TaxID=1324957 RepID=V4HEY3_9EURY|nr:cation diffusion facilitator family transporter [Candidatus Halobonum tyrrellensis G22]
MFLLVGIWFGNREADRDHPFGHGKAQFFYSFLVSVLLFGIAGYASAREGYDALTHGETHLAAGTATVPLTHVSVPGAWVSYGVLVGAIGFEGYAWRKAYREISRIKREHDWSGLVETFEKTSQVTTLTAFTEDSVSITGLVVALVGLAATQLTHDPVYDGVAALVIGVLLMGFALALAWQNKRLLLGESLPADEEAELRAVVGNFEGVAALRDLRSVYFGQEHVVVTADVRFDADMTAEEVAEAIPELEAALRGTNGKVAEVYVEPEAHAPTRDYPAV